MNHIHYSGLCAKSFNRTHHVLWPISRGKMTKELLSIRCGDKSVCLVCCLCIWPHSKIKGRERECFLHSVAGYLQYTALFHFICLLYKKKKVYHRGWRYFSESSTVIQTAPNTPSTWMLSQKSKIDNIICAGTYSKLSLKFSFSKQCPYFFFFFFHTMLLLKFIPLPPPHSLRSLYPLS